MLLAIPLWWQDIREMKNIQDKSAVELAKYVLEYYRYVDSRSPLTADERDIVKWEVLYGIQPNPQKALSERRSVVTAKIRGVGTVTPSLVKFTAESFEFGMVEVSEADGVVTITFVSEKGVPPDLNDIEKALRDILPAHLVVEFKFRYTTYNEVKAIYPTYNNISSSGITYDQLLTAEAGGA